MPLTMGEKIRIVLRRKKITISDLADMVGTSRQNLTNKLNRDNFSEQELIGIAKALGCKFEGFFIFDDGEKI
ncbi:MULTISPECIES: helix-turn-helix transcriptional regulator [unclassified Clostridium]|uniref:helix-turn-helix transcriptional regulator n=1 Tax=unclassified Clostridium TaxID=2614128 RepID=UPI0002978B16|nr:MULTISPECIES: helix-turn-helix transcriptional regulator [unclassified Clostridium]EKQ51775.1 MAG: putative transcriptional regulator [Clostridium sp. Maddingley MBC34-26]